MSLAQKTETWGNVNQSWLGSARGRTSTQTIELKVSAFNLATYAPNGYFLDGIALAKPTSGANVGFGVPLAAKVTEVQTVTITGGPTGGTIALTLDGETVSGIAYNASAATVQTALESLSNVNAGDVAVTGGPGPATPWVVTFGTGTRWAGRDVPQMSAASSLTGGTAPAVAVTTTTPGGGGVTDGSDILAGFLLYPKTVAAGDPVTHGVLLDTGRIIVANLPFTLSVNSRNTNSHFVWA